MANTYTSLHYHFTFSTKDREPWIVAENRKSRLGLHRRHRPTSHDDRTPSWRDRDHIPALVMAPPAFSPSKIAQYLKGESSKWIHEEFPKLRFRKIIWSC